MIELFIIFFCLFKFTVALFYKLTGMDQPDNYFITWASKIKYKRIGDFIYSLFDCKFCMESHISFLLSIPFAILLSDWRLLLLGYAAKGLDLTIKEYINQWRIIK